MVRIGVIVAAALALGAIAPMPALAQTQTELNIQAAKDAQAADKQLNVVYQRLMKKLDAPARKKLVAAELAWIKFRDLQCEVEGDWYRGGSLASMTYGQCKTRLTRERIKDLELALEVHDR